MCSAWFAQSIAVEGVQKGADVQYVICKAKDIIKTFTFKSTMLESEAEYVANEQKVADLESLLEEMERDQQIRNKSQDDDELNHPDTDQTVSFSDVASSSASRAASVRQQTLTTLERLPEKVELRVDYAGKLVN